MNNISIENIYWMLAYAFRTISENDIKKMSNEKFENIYDLFSVMMVQEINKQVKRGLNKEYINFKEETTAIKGKINLSDLMKNSSVKTTKISCEFDDYSINSYLNKIVKTACVYLLRSNRIKDREKAIRLKKAIVFFDEVEEINPSMIQWDIIRYNRFNSSYKILINVSYLILDGLLMSEKSGNFDYREYLDDQKMHKLYEKFILEYYRYHYGILNPSVSQVEWDVKEDNDYISLLPKMQTDITLYKGNRTLIIDAKYYSTMYQSNPMFEKETIKSNNLYQIYTYVKNEDKTNSGNVSGMLLYAKTDENEEQYVDYIMGRNKIIVANLNLSVDFQYTKNQLNSIADKFIANEL